MLWATWWPIVLGFCVSGLVQSMIARNGLRKSLGTDSFRSSARATILGVISSSCSYAASAMSRALFARGASWRNAIIFMVASTNLVVELAVVLYLLLGWQFVVAEFLGGLLMVIGLAFLTARVFSRADQDTLRTRVSGDVPSSTTVSTSRQRLRDLSYWREGARYTIGDVTMVRKELLIGFVVAGFLSVHVPNSWWSQLFFKGHGTLSLLENVVAAPLLAVISFVCSVGNIPLAAALWIHGVAFGGVISFIFADLVTLPLLLIYRRFYGSRAALKLFALLWVVMSLAGFLVDLLFRSANGVPRIGHNAALHGDFNLGPTLVLNILASVALVAVWLLSRNSSSLGATDPICGMHVDTDQPAATRVRDGETFYFCSLRCAEKFDARSSGMVEVEHGDAIDPVCGMRVDSKTASSALGLDGVTYYFCSPGCRTTFQQPGNSFESQKVKLGPKPRHE